MPLSNTLRFATSTQLGLWSYEKYQLYLEAFISIITPEGDNGMSGRDLSANTSAKLSSMYEAASEEERRLEFTGMSKHIVSRRSWWPGVELEWWGIVDMKTVLSMEVPWLTRRITTIG